MHLKKKEGYRATGLSEIIVETLKCGISIMDWLWMICNRCLETGVEHKGWKVTSIIPVYKGRGDRSDFVNHSEIYILGIPGKIYARILANRLVEMTKEHVAMEQGGFMAGWVEAVRNRHLY